MTRDTVRERRIGYLVNRYPAISHTFIKREIQALERRGVTVLRFALRGWDDKLVDADDHREREQTRYVLRNGVASLAGAFVKRAIRTPKRLLAAVMLAFRLARGSDKALVIHLAYLAEACVLVEWLAQARASHLHAHFATNPAEVALFVNALGGPSYSFTAHGSDIMDRPAQSALEHKVGGASFVVAVCSFGRNQIWRWVPFSMWDRIAVLRCGLPTRYGADATPASGNPTRLVCVGRLSKEKGQMLLVEAAARLREAGSLVDVVLVGDGPMRGAVQQLIAQRRLDGQVRLTGWLDALGVEAELREARALVVASLSEGLPMVIMEAMAQRRPVIAPFLAGIPELVIAEETGWLYPAGDVDALAGAIAACLTATPSRLESMGTRAQQRIWAAHDADVQARALLKLFDRPGEQASTAARSRSESYE